MPKIMLIRHAEKHTHGSHERGVAPDGHLAKHELTVRGWQRAGALVALFAPAAGVHQRPHIQTPKSIFASDATKKSPSKRAMHTAAPLADALGIDLNHDYAEDEEEDLAVAISSAPSPVLVVWHHGHLPRLARAIAGPRVKCPPHWPDDRFDLIWILERRDGHAGSWSFCEVTQCLLPGDNPEGCSV